MPKSVRRGGTKPPTPTYKVKRDDFQEAPGPNMKHPTRLGPSNTFGRGRYREPGWHG